MTTLETLKWNGKKAGTVSIDLKVAKETSSADLIHRAVLRQLANKRQGTASTLTRSEVRGGGRKPYKQKGTGRARQGSIRTPLRPGGGVIFGPKPRSYNLDMNRKERRLALRTALMSRISDVTPVEDFASNLNVPKTKEIIEGLLRLGIEKNQKVLVILEDPSIIIYSKFLYVWFFILFIVFKTSFSAFLTTVIIEKKGLFAFLFIKYFFCFFILLI